MILEEIYHLTAEFTAKQQKSKRKEIGQFFSSIETARYMASEIHFSGGKISILDPGAGNGILGAAAIEALLNQNTIQHISVTFIENDECILPLLTQSIKILSEACKNAKVEFEYSLLNDNYIFFDFEPSSFDLVIMNPPYKKIRKGCAEALFMEAYVHGQPNLYSLFMSKSLSLLKPQGQYVYIVPRSWTSGEYYVLTRKDLRWRSNIEHIHIFKSRSNAFKGQNVLQETMIISGVTSFPQDNTIRISSSTDDSYSDLKDMAVPSEIILDESPRQCIWIPESADDVDILKTMHSKKNTFYSLGYIFKTGPVVEFRNRKYLSEGKEADKSLPMFRSQNIVNEQMVFPVQNGKPQYISETIHPLLLPNKNTVLVKRLTSKEEPRRLQSCIYAPIPGVPFISAENHLNYLCRIDKRALSTQEVEWVQNILSSDLYDRYYRIVNGSTQVNATDLNNLPVERMASK